MTSNSRAIVNRSSFNNELIAVDDFENRVSSYLTT
jgi:hypothetical protein